MFLPYSISINEDGSYSFISTQNHSYLIYFTESELFDAENNVHIINSLGFSRDDEHAIDPFTIKYDGRIRATITLAISDFFKKNDHKSIMYFCFSEDGYSRHRNIVFSRWFRDLNSVFEKFDGVINYQNDIIYGSLIIVADNPLKQLIVDSFIKFLKEINGEE